MRINKYVPLRGSSYAELPKEIKSKRPIINVKNKDNKCFIWSILSAIHPVEKDPLRVSKYREYDDKIYFKGIDIPVSLNDIKKFEKNNNISVNIFGYEKSFHPLRITENKLEIHVNLFYMKDHYFWIKKLTSLIRSQIITHQIFVCDRCLRYFRSKEGQEKYKEDCKTHKAVAIDLPTKGEVT